MAKHSLIYGLGMVLTRAVSFFMLPIYTRYLTPADYGIMALIEMTLDFIAILAGARLALGIFRFYHKEDDEEARREIASTAFLLMGALYALVGILVFAGAPLLSEVLFGSGVHTFLVRVAAADLFASSLLIVPLALAQVKDRSTFFVGATLARLFLVIILNLVCLIVLEMGVLGVFVAGLIANAIVGTVLSIWLISISGTGISQSRVTDLLRYGVPLIISSIGTFLATFSDRYFLQAAADEAAVGLYSLAYQFGFLLVTVGVIPMDKVWGPKRFKVATEENGDELLSHGFLIMNVLMFTAAVGISLYVSDVLRVMATPDFYPASQYVSVILIAYIFQSWANILDLGILLEERTKYLAITNLASAAVAVVGYSIFIPRYLAWGAAWVTVASFFVRFALTYGFSHRLRPIRYRWSPVMVLIGWSVLVAGAGHALPALDVLASIAIRTGLVVVFFIGLWTLPILSKSDRVAVVSAVRSGWSSLRAGDLFARG